MMFSGTAPHQSSQQPHRLAAGTITVTTASITLPVVTTSVTTTITTTTTTASMDAPGPSSLAGGAPSTTTATTATSNRGGDSAFAPPGFHGTGNEDAKSWLSRFEKYAVYRGMSDAEKKNFLAVVLRDDASYWFDALQAAATAT